MAVLATPTPATVLAITGCLIAGVPVVPVPADVGAAERRHILTDSGAQAWLGEKPEETDDLPHIPVRLHARSWHRYAEPPPDATALIIYTSGTTGPPKGVVVSRRAIAADIDLLAEAWQWTPDDTLVHGLPLYHVHGLVLGLLGSLRIGNRFVHTGKPAPEAYAAAGGSMYFGVPTVWSRVVDDGDAARALASARLLVSGSAPLPVPVFDGLARLTGHQPVERYGSTESLITLSTRADGERRPGSVGLPLTGVQTRLVDEDGATVPHDGESIGRLQIQSPTMFDGYLNRPEATADAFDADGWYRTGDVAVIDGAGMHRIVGRESVDLIKTGGFRVGAGEIETTLLGHPGVAEVAVIGAPDDDLGQRIVAFVVGDAEPQALIDFVAQQLSAHKRPREVRLVESLPRNAMGKVLKKELTDGSDVRRNLHRRPRRRTLGAWWSKVLGWPWDIDDDGDVVLHAPPGAGPNGCSSPCPTTKSSRTASISTSVPTTSKRRWIASSGLEPGMSTSVRASRAGWCWPTRRATSSAFSPPTTDPAAANCVFARRHAAIACIAHARARDPVLVESCDCADWDTIAASGRVTDLITDLRPLAVAAAALVAAGCAAPVQIEPVSTTAPTSRSGPALYRSGGHRLQRRMDPRWPDAEPVRCLESCVGSTRSVVAQRHSGRGPRGGSGGRRPEDHVGVAVKGIPAAPVR